MARFSLALAQTLLLFGVAWSQPRTHVLRLHPGQDLKQALLAYRAEQALGAAWISTCVGSLHHLRLRLANRSEISQFDGYFEIVSLTGTLSADGLHLHLSASDENGATFGGHLVDGNEVYTTAEIVILEDPGLRFQRVLDPDTGSLELQVAPRQ
ncbi:MAG: PPC domain-containing DNA-binding protein [Vulcanimicrobiota bacterium]